MIKKGHLHMRVMKLKEDLKMLAKENGGDNETKFLLEIHDNLFEWVCWYLSCHTYYYCFQLCKGFALICVDLVFNLVH